MTFELRCEICDKLIARVAPGAQALVEFVCPRLRHAPKLQTVQVTVPLEPVAAPASTALYTRRGHRMRD